ncbi:MAG: dTMP kinase [Cellvibrionales bacterium]|nr:dTMP kinase [Cellvibrionales bacterium]
MPVDNQAAALKPKKGLFIVLDGGEGVGKSTNSAFIQQYLVSQSIDFISTREPGGTPFAEKIRQLVLAEAQEPVNALSELLLIFAARAQHLNQKILPALNRGEWVLCDRFTDATYAYQGGGRRIESSLIADCENLVQGQLRPDLTIILDAPLAVTRKRLDERESLDRMEKESIDFHERVAEIYCERALASPETHVLIDASQPLDKVQSDIEKVLHDSVSQWRDA